jgi:chromosome segregation ATPase
MKRQITTMFMVGAVTAGVFQACGKRVSGGSGNAVDPGLPGCVGNSCDSNPTTGGPNDQLYNDLLKRLKDEERARLEGDQSLQAQIDDLRNRLKLLEDKVADDVQRLTEEDAKIRVEMAADKAYLESSMQQIADNLNNAIQNLEAKSAMKTELAATKDELNAKINALEVGYKAADDAIKMDYNAKIAALELAYKAADAAQKLVIEAQINQARIDMQTALTAAQADFQNKINAMDVRVVALENFRTQITQQMATVQTTLNNAVTDINRLKSDLLANTAIDNSRYADLLAANVLTQAQIDTLKAQNITRDQKIALLETTLNTTNTKVASLENQMTLTIAELNALKVKQADDIQKIKDDLAANKAIDDARYTELLNANVLTQAQIDTLKNGATDINAKIALLQQKDSALQAEINTINQAIVTLSNTQITTSQALQALQQRQQDFEAYANATFASKQDLQAVQNAVSSLSSTVNVMGSDVNILKSDVAGIKNQISNEILTKITSLDTKIQSVEAKVDSVAQQFNDHLVLYHTEFSQVTTSVADAINNLRNEVNTNINNVRAYADTLNNRIVTLEAFVDSFTGPNGSFEQKLAELRAYADQSADAAAQDAYQRAVAEATAKYNQLANTVSADKQALQNQLNQVIQDLEDVRRTALAAQQMAQANEQKINILNGKVEELKAADAQIKAQMDALKVDLSQKMDDIRNEAMQAVSRLDVKVQAQFVEVNAKIAELSTKLEQTIRTITVIIMPVIRDESIASTLEKAQRETNLVASERLYEYRVAQHRVEEAFVQAIDPVLGQAGVDVRALNLSFRSIAGLAQCNGFPGTGDEFASIKDKEWFFHLARSFVRELVATTRSGAAYENIFLGYPKLYVNDTVLKSLALIGASEPYASGTAGDCLNRVRAWALGSIIGTSPNAVALRRALLASEDFRQAVGDIYVKATRLDAPFDELIRLVRNALIQATGSDAGLFTSTNGQPSIIAQIADLLLEQSENAAALDEIRALRETFVGLAREMARLEDQTNNNTAAITALNQRLAALDTKLNAYKAATDARLNSLTTAVQTSFNLIASIAARLGYDELVQAALEATEAIGGTLEIIPQNPPPGCFMAQHGYVHISNTALPSTYCDGAPTRFDTILSGDKYTKCALHGSGENAWTWGNLTEVSNGWNAHGQWSSDNHKVQNGLLMKSMEPTDAKAKQLSRLKKGSRYADHQVTNATGEASLNFYIVGGSNAKWRMTAENITTNVAGRWVHGPVNISNPHREIREVLASEFKVGREAAKNAYMIPGNFAISPLGSCRWDRQVTIEALDANNQPVGPKCVHRMHQFSPIVLNLQGSNMIDTVNPILSNAHFDLDGNGRLEKTGWIKQGTGLLAIDLNGNGTIDSGRELFGEATQLPNGERAANGYAAMTQYDDNADGRIDAKDQAFHKMLVWVDANMDGKSESYEMYSLSKLSITALATSYQDVAADQVIQHHGLPESNLVKYESRFWGPEACGLGGCKSYDVFFGSTESFSVSRN